MCLLSFCKKTVYFCDKDVLPKVTGCPNLLKDGQKGKSNKQTVLSNQMTPLLENLKFKALKPHGVSLHIQLLTKGQCTICSS